MNFHTVTLEKLSKLRIENDQSNNLHNFLRGPHHPKLSCVFKFCSTSILYTKSLHNTIRNLVTTEISYPANADGDLAVL